MGFGWTLVMGIILEASWEGFWRRIGDHFGSFWTLLGELIGIILASFSDVGAPIHFYMLGRWILMGFESFWRSKNEHFAWEVLKKSNFRSDGWLMPTRTDFGLILGAL